jgi:gliding motility-associated-like protein
MPVTPGVFSNTNGRQFIQKLTADLQSMLISTVFGSGRAMPDISPTAFLVDQCERIYVCGWGGTNNTPNGGNVGGMITTANALQRTTDNNDFYLIQLAPYATAVEYATYFGGTGSSGEHVDGGTSRFDRRGFVYQAVCGGCGGSSSFPIPPGAGSFSATNRAFNCNNAAFKIDFGINAAVAGPNQNVCANGAAVQLTGSPAGGTWTGTGVTGSVSTGYSFTPSAALIGTHTLTYSVASTGTCVTTSVLNMTVRPVTPVTFNLPAATCPNSSPIQLTATPAGGTFSGPGVSGNLFTPSAAGVGSHNITYTLPAEQCGSATQRIIVNALPQVVAGPDTALCAFQRTPYQLRGFSPVGGTWSGTGCTPGGFFTPPTNASGPIMLTYSYTDGNSCTQTAQRRIMLVPDNSTNRPLELPQCQVKPRPTEGIPLYTGLAPFTHTFNHDLLFASTYSWDFGDGNTSTEQFPTHTFDKPGTYLVKFTARYNSTCQANTQFAPVYVGNPYIPNIITPNGDSLNDVFEQRLSCLPVRIQVFSRWGNLVYETQDYRNNWGGGTLPNGIYYYHLLDVEGRKAKGWLEIQR